MNHRYLRLGWLVACFLLLSGCADTHYVMRLDPDGSAGQVRKVWPQPPETPRYAYVGELTGENNFHDENEQQRSAGVKFLYWLVGLTAGNREPVVLQRPVSGMVDGQGRILVTDASRRAVFVFDGVAGKLDVWDQAKENVRFESPVGIAPGPNGQILVADAKLGEVIRLDSAGNPVGSFGKGILKWPTGLARDGKRGRVFVVDTYAHDIKVFDDAGKLLDVIGRRGTGPGEFNFPTHLALADGKLYVADTLNSRVQVLDEHGGFLRQFGERGLYVGNMVRPKGVAVDSDNNVYVVESMHDYLLVFNRDGRFLMPIGGTGKKIGEFYLPAGAWTDPHNRIYVADMFNGRVVIFQYLTGMKHAQKN